MAMQTQDHEAKPFPMPSVTLDNRSHIAIDGEDAEHFLHNLVTTDIVGLPIEEWRAGALLTAQGKVLFAFLIARSATGFVVDVASRDAAEFVRRLKFFRLRAKVAIADPVPISMAVVWQEAKPEGLFFRDSRFGGLDVWRGAETVASGAQDGVWTALRIAYGVAEPHVDYAYSDVFPHDINLDQIGGLSFSKGCYVGQEVVSRMHHRGTGRWRLMVATGIDLVEKSEVIAGGKIAGALGSVEGNAALAVVRLDRIKYALDSSAPVLAGGKAIELSFPIAVQYSWPQVSEREA
jgi:tRNA-modifying protein YgfZ